MSDSVHAFENGRLHVAIIHLYSSSGNGLSVTDFHVVLEF